MKINIYRPFLFVETANKLKHTFHKIFSIKKVGNTILLKIYNYENNVTY